MKKNVIKQYFSKSNLKKIYSIFRASAKNIMFTFMFFFLVVIILLSVSVVEFQLNKNKQVSMGPLFSAYVVVTESMVPTINVNDGIVVKRVDNKDIEIGDVITFLSSDDRYSGRTITHRVIDKYIDDGTYFYTTKGDNNIVVDPGTINLENIYGKVIFKIPKIGYIQDFVSTPIGFVLSILIPIITVIVYETYRIISVVKKKNSQLINL